MTLKPLGDSAWLVAFPPGTPHGRVAGVAAALRNSQPAGVLDVVASFDTLAVHFDADDGSEIRDWIREAANNANLIAPDSSREVEIPVCYDGLDLAEVAARVGLSAAEVLTLHSGATYRVAAVGFSPGFPYLSGLPERLHVPRRETPRLNVPAGSVAIAGGQAGIYPFTSPGGWHVLGSTGKILFDPLAELPSLLGVGDRVRFVPVASIKITEKKEAAHRPATDHCIEVVRAGGLTTVQDLGRPGFESSGVSPGGAADRCALRMANLAVGNPEDAACLEICVSGPVLKFHGDAVIAFIDGSGYPKSVNAGETVDFTKLNSGARAYLAVSGGIEVPEMLGSASTDLRAGFGGFAGRALQAGDRLNFGATGRVPRSGAWHVGRCGRASEVELRFLSGVQDDWFSVEAFRRFRETIYQVTPRSDRMGVRLSGESLDLATPRSMVSQPVACGSVQVPPDGQPIVLMAERQTIGGYPQIAHVISVDLPKLAQAWPATRVKFREVTLEQAVELKSREKQDFAWLRTGLELLKSSSCDAST